MVRDRRSLTYRISWDDRQVDVSADVVDFAVQHGSGVSNSERSTVLPASGRLVLRGDDYAPGSSGRFTPAALHARAAMVVLLGTVELWRGWVEAPFIDPVIAGATTTRYRAVGRLDELTYQSVDLASSTTDLSTDAVLWATVGSGLPRLTGAAGAGLSFSPFVWSGRALEFAGVASGVMGRLAGEDSRGRLTLPTYARVPPVSDRVSVRVPEVMVVGVETHQDVRHIRNRLLLPFAMEGTRRKLAADGTSTQQGGMGQSWAASTTATLTIPEPPAGSTIENIAVSVEAATVRVPATLVIDRARRPAIHSLGRSNVYDFSRFVQVSHTVQGRVVTVTITNTLAANKPRFTITQHYWNRDNEYSRTTYSRTWDGFFWSGSADAPSNDDRFLSDAVVRFRVRYEVAQASIADVVFQSITSQTDWGVRPLEWPLWVSNVGLGTRDVNGMRIQTDVNHLGDPRTYHRVSIPLWQSEQAISDRVADLDYGDYVDLVIHDTVRAIAIAKVCVVALRRIEDGDGAVPTVHLTFLETGVDAAVTPPGPPRNLTLAPSSRQLTASWDKPATGGAPTRYGIRYRAVTADDWTSMTTTGRTYSIGGLTNGTAYQVEVQAVNGGGASIWVRATGTPAAVPVPPGPVRGLAVRAGSQFLAVAWLAPNTGDPATSYSLRYRAGTSGDWTTTTGLTSTTRTITGLTNGTSYQVEVQAVNATGNSAWSRVTRTPMAVAAGPPRNLAVKPGDGQLVVSWDAPNTGGAAATYDLRYRTGQGSYTTISAIAGTTRTITGLTNGTLYEVGVQAVNTAGRSDWVSGSGTPADVLRPPRNLTNNYFSGTLTRVVWEASLDETSSDRYQVAWKRMNTGAWQVLTNVANVGSRFWWIFNADRGRTHAVRVRLLNGGSGDNFTKASSWAMTTWTQPSGSEQDPVRIGITVDGIPVTIGDRMLTVREP